MIEQIQDHLYNNWPFVLVQIGLFACFSIVVIGTAILWVLLTKK